MDQVDGEAISVPEIVRWFKQRYQNAMEISEGDYQAAAASLVNVNAALLAEFGGKADLEAIVRARNTIQGEAVNWYGVPHAASIITTDGVRSLHCALLERITVLERLLLGGPPPMGHNNPPRNLDEAVPPKEQQAVAEAGATLKETDAIPTDIPPALRSASKILREAASKIASYILKEGGAFVHDTANKTKLAIQIALVSALMAAATAAEHWITAVLGMGH